MMLHTVTFTAVAPGTSCWASYMYTRTIMPVASIRSYLPQVFVDHLHGLHIQMNL